MLASMLGNGQTHFSVGGNGCLGTASLGSGWTEFLNLK